MCTNSPPDPPREAPPNPLAQSWVVHGYASGANSNQECSLCWRPCCLGPNFEFGVRGHVSNKAPSVFFAPTGHPFQGLLLLESTLRFRIYAAAQHGGTHHGDSDPWCVASKVASLAQSSRCFSHSLEQSSIGFFSHLPVTCFRVVSSLKARYGSGYTLRTQHGGRITGTPSRGA